MQTAVDELRAEFADIAAVLETLTDDQWVSPTPAAGWDVRDQVSHLADTNEICVDTITGGPRPLNDFGATFESPEAFTESGCERGRAMTPAQVFEWWKTSCDQVSEALLALDPKARVPWGLGMSARMMATARLMEHWAHALDIRAVAGLGPNIGPRMKSIAFLVLKAVPYGLSYAGVEQPPGTLRAELRAGNDEWRLGPEDATDVIAGDALDFCLVGVQRASLADAPSLTAKGPLAEAALANLRAFL